MRTSRATVTVLRIVARIEGGGRHPRARVPRVEVGGRLLRDAGPDRGGNILICSAVVVVVVVVITPLGLRPIYLLYCCSHSYVECHACCRCLS